MLATDAPTLTFWGAARTVTGSRYLLETPRARILIDAGMFQDRDKLALNWTDYGFDPASIDAVLLTHGHLDHAGWLPKLVKDGFRGPVYATPATVDLVPILVADTARIQMEDARQKAKRHAREGRVDVRPAVPLYDTDDADRAVRQLRPVGGLGRPVDVAPGVTATWEENGHILGAAWIAVEADGRRIVFSGDIGRWDRPILHDPRPPTRADYIVMESTYGDRTHRDAKSDTEAQMEAAVDEATRRGGLLLIPSFSVERAQELLYLLSRLAARGKLPPGGVHLDSPMASKVTDLFKKHPEECDDAMRDLIARGQGPFDFPGLRFVGTAEESKKLNAVTDGAVVIAGNGMCTGGRIKHHLAHHLDDPRTTVLFVGYQAKGTLGRLLVDGAREVRLFNRPVAVRAAIRQLDGLSGHADRLELHRWLDALEAPPRGVFVTHGDPEASEAFASQTKVRRGWTATCPAQGDRVTLS